MPKHLRFLLMQIGENYKTLNSPILLGLRGREDLPVNCLSAGQKRRVLLARLLLRKAKRWILDEPFNALDVRAVEMLSELISEHIVAGGMAIMTSHQAIPMPNGGVVQL